MEGIITELTGEAIREGWKEGGKEGGKNVKPFATEII
jgi:hypothetical protein